MQAATETEHQIRSSFLQCGLIGKGIQSTTPISCYTAAKKTSESNS